MTNAGRPALYSDADGGFDALGGARLQSRIFVGTRKVAPLELPTSEADPRG